MVGPVSWSSPVISAGTQTLVARLLESATWLGHHGHHGPAPTTAVLTQPRVPHNNMLRDELLLLLSPPPLRPAQHGSRL